jgi:hypothetical protein
LKTAVRSRSCGDGRTVVSGEVIFAVAPVQDFVADDVSLVYDDVVGPNTRKDLLLHGGVEGTDELCAFLLKPNGTG